MIMWSRSGAIENELLLVQLKLLTLTTMLEINSSEFGATVHRWWVGVCKCACAVAILDFQLAFWQSVVLPPPATFSPTPGWEGVGFCQTLKGTRDHSNVSPCQILGLTILHSLILPPGTDRIGRQNDGQTNPLTFAIWLCFSINAEA